MADKNETAIVQTARIENCIHVLRSEKVMLDTDLAALYGVPTKVFNQAVKRNMNRFPEDFMFQITLEEAEFLRSQIVTSKTGRGGRRTLPYAFQVLQCRNRFHQAPLRKLLKKGIIDFHKF